MIEAIDRQNLSDIVAERLKTYLVEHKLKPGDRLPTEAQLAERFGVSRLSLREATRSLAFLGILAAKPGRGLTVGRVSMSRVADFLDCHPDLADAEPLTLIDTRVVIETGVLPYVARRMQADATIHTRLSDINQRLQAAQTLQEWVALDIEFHRSLMAASGLTPLLAFANVLALFFRRFRESVKKGDWAKGAARHQAILDALQADDVAQATDLLRQHIESHKQRLGAHPQGA